MREQGKTQENREPGGILENVWGLKTYGNGVEPWKHEGTQKYVRKHKEEIENHGNI